MPHAEIAAFVREHDLAPIAVDRLQALVARLAGASFAPTLLLAEGSAGQPTLSLGPADEAATEEVTPADLGTMPVRYEDLGQLGVGGMGEVRRVRDRELGRTCAYKVIRADLASKPSVVARFVEEAQVAAQLQHPNIAPVYDAGRLSDGRTWFTMKEIRGRTLTELFREVHAGEVTDAALRRLGDVFARVCDGVGYAHARGVVHRDLKPDNVMVGAHGEVLVLDWGLAKVLGRRDLALEEGDLEPEVVSGRSADESQKTRVGGVLGTAAYMPPEQARGQVDQLDARSDVYALGAILYELLAGRPPYEGRDARAVLRQVLAGPPEPPGRATGPDGGMTFTLGVEALEVEAGGPSLPEELVALCELCMAREPGDRPVDGAAVATLARAWLDGARKREKALEVVTAADAVVAEAAALRERAVALRAEGLELLAPVKAWAPEEEKAPGWAKEDEAEAVEREASLLELKREALLQGALTHTPELPEAHAALAELELTRHRVAEGEREEKRVARAEVRLWDHVLALPEDHEVRRQAVTYLKGDGALTLTTDPAGAEVELYRYETRNRRLVAERVGRLGKTPLVEVPLPMGSYLCVLRHPERTDVRYPVSIGRGEHWDGVAPGEGVPRAVHLPMAGELCAAEVYVPAGWFGSGGDVEAAGSLPRRRLWCEGLVVQRYPVTNREYLVFLDDLVQQGREEEALRWVPRARAGSAGAEGAMECGRDAAGRFVLQADAEGDVWLPEWPVADVHFGCAVEYGRWLTLRTGHRWRLPCEFEREKAARGVDGRFFPWGNVLDPSWCRMRDSHPVRPLPAEVDSFPVDESVYGARGMGGNIQDWCADWYMKEGPATPGGRVVVPEVEAEVDLSPASRRVGRGGNWYGSARLSRCAHRGGIEPSYRCAYLGLRLVRSYPLSP